MQRTHDRISSKDSGGLLSHARLFRRRRRDNAPIRHLDGPLTPSPGLRQASTLFLSLFPVKSRSSSCQKITISIVNSHC